MKRQYMKTVFLFGDDEKRAADIYYALRLGFLHQMANYSERPLSSSKKAIRTANYKAYEKLLAPDQYYQMVDNYFAYYFRQQLNAKGISSEYVVAVPRYLGGLEDVVLDREVTYGIYIPSIDKYYWPFDNYMNAGEMDYRLFNVPVYLTADRDGYNTKDHRTPNSSAKDHKYINDINLTIKDNNIINFKHDVTFKGAYKQLYFGMILYQEKYVDEDDDRLAKGKIKREKEKLEKKVNKRKKKKNKISEKDLAEIKSELSEQKKENILGWIQEDFKTEEIAAFDIISNGRFGDDLKVKLEYEAEDYIKKAGSNLIFDIGKMIGAQIELDEEDLKERTKDAHINFAKTIHNNLTIELPEGYKAEGIEKLNMDVDNEYGAFSSVAKIKGNILTVKTKKTYKNQTIPAKEWPKMIEMLELAFQFFQQKIILKK